MNEKYKYPPDASWNLAGWWKGRLRSRRLWKVFVISLCLTAPLCGFLGVLLDFGEGMASFGPRSEVGLLDLLVLFTRFPVPQRNSTPIIIFNSVFWAACASLIFAVLLARPTASESNRDEPPTGAT